MGSSNLIGRLCWLAGEKNDPLHLWGSKRSLKRPVLVSFWAKGGMDVDWIHTHMLITMVKRRIFGRLWGEFDVTDE